ncbi:lysozyme inhibitor LprI family protein [Pantoea sp. 1.19]|uniref:lysozyme inhibitor LprI family protein n=1 Tax=Pantoea sp. 1.19 TaxID=1925589 RepID=UPI0009F9488F|nr:lysozyme inhibitor LprI family protein [Pantoea sp. 1.19]
MHRIRMMTAALLLTLPLAAQAQAQAQEDALDRTLNGCLNTANTTQQMNACYQAAITGWDAAMNQAYQQALARGEPARQRTLREAQRRWLSYRDAWMTASRARFDQGTLASVSQAVQLLMLNKNQTLMLRSLQAQE